MPVNCAGIPETLLESELFGHVKGSFTGAYRDKPGKLEMADNGTIFLDEIGEMTLRMQGLLLRFLETGEIQKVGAERVSMATNVRVIAATNRNLRDLIAQGQFREDLFYRSSHSSRRAAAARTPRGHSAAHRSLPAGASRAAPWHQRRRQRQRQRQGANGQAPRYSCAASRRRRSPPSASTPGRATCAQLENVIERLVVTGRREVIQVDDLGPEIRTPSSAGMRPRKERRRTVADDLFKKLVEHRESFWDDGLSALHEPRDHARQRPRPRAQRSRGSARELQDRAATVQHGAARLQAVPQLPAEARLPAAVQRISPVRVLYCEGNFDGTIGGSYYSLLYLLEKLDRRRIDPLLILRRDTPLLSRFQKAAGEVRIIERRRPFQIPGRSSSLCRRAPLLGVLLGALQSGINLVRFCLTVLSHARLLKRDRVRLVHLNNSVTSNHDWMLASMLARVPCVSHERGMNERYSAMARWCAPRLSAIICISQAVHDKLVERGVARRNLHLVHNGLDPTRVVPGRSAEDVRRAFGLEAGQPVIGMIGNIRWWKGQEVVIRALPAIVRRVPNVKCLFVGETAASDRQYAERLQDLTRELGVDQHVVFTGYCANVADALSVMDVSLLASITPEPFGRVLLEAMAMSKPIVASRAGAVTEIVEEGVTGHTFASSDAEELAVHVLDLLEHPGRARAFGAAGYERLVSRFHLDRNVEQTMAVYARILGLSEAPSGITADGSASRENTVPASAPHTH